MISSFLLPANGVMTPEEVERRRKMADELDKQGEINGPIRTPLEGFGKLANALMGGFVRSQADKTEKKSRSNAFSAMTNALVGGGSASSQPVSASPANTKGADPGIVAYIREAAVKRGINPDIAVQVAMSEGLKANPADGWQSNVMRNGKREESYGPFQLYMGGGLGNEFVKATGLDPRNPGTVNQQVDFALDKARQGGWGPWNGAKAIGLDPWAGIDRNAPAMAQGQPMPQPQQPGAPQAQPANYTPAMDGGMVQPAQTGGRMQQLQGLIMSPDFQWLAPEQQQFVMQAYEAERAAMNPDPMKQLQMQKLQAEIAGMGQAKPTDDMREYEFAKSQGFQGTFQDFMLAMKKAGASNVTVEGQKYGTIPPGYSLKEGPDGAQLIPIPGGPAAAEAVKSNDMQMAKNSSRMTLTDTITTAAQNARSLADGWFNTGLTGQGVSNLGNTDAAELYRQIGVLKANATIQNLQAMRRESPTGGALGNVTEQEGAMLAAASGALDPAAGSERFKKALDNYELTLLRIVHGYDAGNEIYAKMHQSNPPVVNGSRATGQPKIIDGYTIEQVE